ncbi:hypothetical protein [Halorussus marinus]|uniref:hypothetical protein n=1 Tax=Halorussus marinus TaxID=2505976 RepID=UPI00106E034F|nr:hypothetical protein [Halorussus marinus]
MYLQGEQELVPITMPKHDFDEDDMPELARAHSEGDVTIRQIATLTGLSSEEVYNRLVELYDEHDLSDD